MAVAYPGLGDKNRTLTYLQKAYEERCDLIPTIKVSPLRIAKGMEADLVVLTADPAVEITALSKVRYTIRNGILTYQGR